MANSAVPITSGSGTNIDTRTAADGDHRQVVVIGDDGSNNVATMTVNGTKNTLDVNFAASQGGAAVTTGALAGSGTAVTATVSSAGNGTIVIYGGSYTDLPITFEGSIDGTNWFQIDGVRVDGTAIDYQTRLRVAQVYAWNFIAPGYSQVRVRQTAAGTVTTQPSVAITQGPFLYDPSPTISPIDGMKDTFTAYANTTGNIASDIFRLSGSATRLVKVTRCEIIGIAGVATASTVRLIKRSTANTGGTSAAAVYSAMDSGQNAQTASAVGYTVASTLGTDAGTVRAIRQTWATTGSQASWDFGAGRPSKCPTLRGVAEGLSVNVGTAFGTSANWTVVMEWTEEPL